MCYEKCLIKEYAMNLSMFFAGKNVNGSKNTGLANKMEHATLCDTKSKAGWVSPVYSQARDVRLDPNIMVMNRCMTMFEQSGS